MSVMADIRPAAMGEAFLPENGRLLPTADAAAEQEVFALVDTGWYCECYPDVAASGVDPKYHYVTVGWREGRHPNRYFDPEWYVAQNPQAASGNPLLHYVTLGEAAGSKPVQSFDPIWYRSAHLVPSHMSCLRHFLLHRFSGTVSPNPYFDSNFYIAANPDVAASSHDPFEHYRTVGREEGRLPRPERDLVLASGLFDANYYLIANGDVRQIGMDAVDHFCGAGWREGRKPNQYFDPCWYTKHAGLQPDINPIVHYILHGEKENRRPSLSFDTRWYRQAYAPAASDTPLAHYLSHRRTQQFSPNPLFDVNFYVTAYGHEIGLNRDLFAHYLTIGAIQDYNPSPYFDTKTYRRNCMESIGHDSGGRDSTPSPLEHFLLSRVLSLKVERQSPSDSGRPQRSRRCAASAMAATATEWPSQPVLAADITAEPSGECHVPQGAIRNPIGLAARQRRLPQGASR